MRLESIDAIRFDRRFSAVLSALSDAVKFDLLGSWRVVVGVPADTALDSDMLSRCDRMARAAGGQFASIPIEEGAGRIGGDSRLLGDGNDDLILVLDSDVLILTTTIVRMLGSLGSGASAVNARVVPLEGPQAQNLAATGTTYGDNSCVLFSRRVLKAAGGVGIHSALRDRGVDSVTYCPEAVVFRDRRLPALSDSSQDGHVPDVRHDGSLLEEAVSAPGLAAARGIITHKLTETSSPLVSVVMRTQAHRPEALRDALLCLAGQTDARFELLLVVHNGDPDAAARILDDQPEWLKSRTRILAASGGTRSRPINLGIAAATGSLVTFLDDDDLVFGHWVESFLDAAALNPRRLLRASAAVQRVTSAAWPGSIEGHSSESKLSTPYPAVYDLADHLRVNMTPFMAFAFPRGFFALFGGAEESLEVCEDWDLTLRAASVLGVSDIPALTAVYRRWNSGGDSYSLHDTSAWERDMLRVRQRLDNGSLLLPPGSASELARFSATRNVASELSAVYSSSSWRFTAPIRTAVTQVGRLVRGVRAIFRSAGP